MQMVMHKNLHTIADISESAVPACCRYIFNTCEMAPPLVSEKNMDTFISGAYHGKITADQ
jgi:hypothetical protein